MKGRVLVTGASGFVGRQAVPALREAGFEVLTPARRDADLLDPAAARRLVLEVEPEYLLHLAWDVTPGKYWESPGNRLWVETTRALARAFGEAGGRRFVGAGTCAEYDWTSGDGLCVPGATPLKPATLYGVCKDAARAALEEEAAAGGFSAAWGRIFHLYGPHEHPLRFVPSVAAALLEGRPAKASSGVQIRDFLHVRDAGRAFAALLAADVAGAVNIGSGRAETLAFVARTLARLAGRPELLRLGDLPSAPNDPLRLVPDLSALRVIGFSPRFELEDGLADALAWRRAQAAEAR